MNSTFIQKDVFQQCVFSFSLFLPTSNTLSEKSGQFYMSWADSNICE